MATRPELNTQIASALTAQVDISDHILANQLMLDYTDQEVAAVKAIALHWDSEKGGFYNKTQVNTYLAAKADLVNGLIPVSQLPGYIDQIQEFETFDDFPETGEVSKIYLDLSTNYQYRWGGTVYTQLLDGNFVLNQTTLQPNSNFNISGVGVIGDKLGIGVSSPQATLDVSGDSQFLGTFYAESAVSALNIGTEGTSITTGFAGNVLNFGVGKQEILLGANKSGVVTTIEVGTNNQVYLSHNSGSNLKTVTLGNDGLKVSTLAGVGNRMVVANASGVLSTQPVVEPMPVELFLEDSQFSGDFTSSSPLVYTGKLNIQNSTGVQQFQLGANEGLKFEATGGATVSFDPATKKVTFNASSGGGMGSIYVDDTMIGGTGTSGSPLTLINNHPIQDAAGVTQFSLNPNDALRFDGTGGTTVSFNSTTKQITINSPFVNIDSVPTNGSTNSVSSDGVFDALALKQASLVSGTNIKTVNGTSLLGSGDLSISTGISGVGSTGRVGIWGGTSAMGSDSALRFDVAENQLIIGSGTPDNPVYKLHIGDDGVASKVKFINNDVYHLLLQNGTASAFLGSEAGNVLVVSSTVGTNVAKIGMSTTYFKNLEGTGTQMIVADSSGNLSRQAIPSGGSGLTGTGTANRLAYWSGTGSLTSDSNLSFNGSLLTNTARTFLADGVDIGTNFGDNDIALSVASDKLFGFGVYSAAGGPKLVVRNDRVGVGTGNPVVSFDSPGAGRISALEFNQVSANNNFMMSNLYYDGGTGFHYRGDGFGSVYQFFNGGFVFYTALLGSAGALATPINRYSVDGAGDFAIANLSGTGTRMVVASATGVLSTQAIPTGGSGDVTLTGTQTLTNKTMSGSSNTFSNIPQSAVTSLTSDLAGKAANVLAGYSSGAGTVASTDTVLQAIQKLNGNDALKAPLASPTFTGTVVLPSTTSIGSVSNTELGYLDGVTSAIQTQLNGKQASLVSGTSIKTVNGTSLLGSGDISIPVGDVTLAGTQTLTNKTMSGASNTFSNIPQSAVTSLSTDLAAKAPLASPALTGVPTAPTATAGTSTTQLATTAFVQTAAAGVASAGVWYPSLATVANITTITSIGGSYMRVGNIINYYFTIAVEPTVAGGNCSFLITIEPSNLTNTYDISGCFVTTLGDQGFVYADTSTDQAACTFKASTTSGTTLRGSYSVVLK